MDEGARSYRRASLQDIPIRALDHSKLSASVVIDLEDLPGIKNLAFEDESGSSGILKKSQSVSKQQPSKKNYIGLKTNSRSQLYPIRKPAEYVV